MQYDIHTHRWRPKPGAPKQSRGIYLVHGVGEHGGRYQRFAEFLTSLGFEVGAHDHPGHGRSGGKRGVVGTDDALVDAAAISFKAFSDETGAKPILFGHSLGGLVVSAMVLDKKVEVHSLILSAPAFAPFIGRSNQLKLRLLELIAPRFVLELPYDPSRLTHDLEEQLAGRDDPLNHRYRSAGLVGWIVRTGERMLGLAQTLSVPTLVLVPMADSVVKASAVLQFVESVPSQFVTAHEYEGFLHEALNESPERRDRVMADVADWLKLVT